MLKKSTLLEVLLVHFFIDQIWHISLSSFTFTIFHITSRIYFPLCLRRHRPNHERANTLESRRKMLDKLRSQTFRNRTYNQRFSFHILSRGPGWHPGTTLTSHSSKDLTEAWTYPEHWQPSAPSKTTMQNSTVNFAPLWKRAHKKVRKRKCSMFW